MRMNALFRPTWQASVAARIACALISIAVMSVSAVMVVVRRSIRSAKYRISPKQPPGLMVFRFLPDRVTLTSPAISR